VNRIWWIAIVLVFVAFVPLSRQASEVKVASKKFTESVILGEIVAQSFSAADVTVQHYRELGGTRVAFNALLEGQVDAYPEYTGTIQQEILRGESVDTVDAIAKALGSMGIEISKPFGFNNTYALAMKRDRAESLGIETISDLARHPQLAFGFGNEFLDRGDGWRALADHYGFQFNHVRGLDHDIAYRRLVSGSIDVMDAYSTDAKIDELDLAILEDDLGFFPRYEALLLYRSDLVDRHPELLDQIERLAGAIPRSEMVRLNRQTEIDGVNESTVAADFLENQFAIENEVRTPGVLTLIVRYTIEHLDLVRQSLIPAIFCGIPLGILAFRYRRFGSLILGSVGIIQTIPALALLVVLMPLVGQFGGQSIGTGSLTAVLALFLYSLLPIVRGTYTGLADIESYYLESAKAMGLSSRFRLWNVELPLATRSVLSGIKTAAVINVGYATLGALIGAGGFGQPILTGIRLADTSLILQGALPAAGLAIAMQWFFDRVEYWIIPRGLRN
jgi:osmoprotectant transport system permease protein